MGIYLGEFAPLLLATVRRLGAEAYGVDIARDLEARAGRRVSRGALYTSPDRLENKGLLRWKAGAGNTGARGAAAAAVSRHPDGSRRIARIARRPETDVARHRTSAQRAF
jgi:Transcriptional regulator PadR-like family.